MHSKDLRSRGQSGDLHADLPWHTDMVLKRLAAANCVAPIRRALELTCFSATAGYPTCILKVETEDSQNGKRLQVGGQFVLVAWRSLFDPWIPDEVGEVLRISSVRHRDSAQPAFFRWDPFSVYFGHVGDGTSRLG
jgi:hypothetical protein